MLCGFGLVWISRMKYCNNRTNASALVQTQTIMDITDPELI